MEERTARRLLWELIESESTLVLATGDEAGPWAAPLFYVPIDGTLCWLSSPRSRHAAAGSEGLVAVAIFASTFRWEEIRGAQILGRVETVDRPADRDRILVVYRARFALGDGFDERIAQSTLYRLRPVRARYLDNRAGFGGRFEISFE